MAYQQNHNPFSPIAKGGLWANIHAKRARGESPAHQVTKVIQQIKLYKSLSHLVKE